MSKKIEKTVEEKLAKAREALEILNDPKTWLHTIGEGGADYIRSIIKQGLEESK